jgi:hypothetical protein
MAAFDEIEMIKTEARSSGLQCLDKKVKRNYGRKLSKNIHELRKKIKTIVSDLKKSVPLLIEDLEVEPVQD